MARRGGGGHPVRRGSLLTRVVGAVFAFVLLAEFEILFFLFFFIAFLIFKDLLESFVGIRKSQNSTLGFGISLLI
ncbi:hypothetical protein COCNU_11G002780 [Cocos nucifera]|uniref:Uncharacterized protein n=1 Tax=Cocos nucifera TaxID=13894 RepID=A0A8K0IND5_COCNU|nr:hypothetical protein COCNU_11G002780 [Cocos nucifera]